MPCRPWRARQRSRGWRGCWSSSCVESALGLGEAGPAAGPGVLAGLDPAGARLAADRGVAVGEEGVDLDLVLTGIGEELVEGPCGQRVDLDQAVLGVPRDERGVGAGRPLLTPHTGDPRRVEGQGAG